MRKALGGTLLAATILSATPAFAAPRAIDAVTGPILATAADPATIDRECDRVIAEATRLQAALENETGPATIGTTLQKFDDLSLILANLGGEAGLYQEVMADEPRRKAGGACQVKVSSAASRLSLSRKVYDRLKAIDASKADAETKLYLQRTIEGFDRSGVALDDAGRAEVQALNDKISAAGTAFDLNIAQGRKTISADPAELAGLPADYIAAHKPGADGKVTISTDYPDYVPVMTYATSEPLRRRLYEAYQTRAHPVNDDRLREMLDLRQQLATRLGRKDHATLILEDKMLNTPGKVEALLAEMSAAAKPAAARDYAKKLAIYRQTHPGATSFNPWDNTLLSNLVQKAEYNYDRQEARQYFAYDNVRDGILRFTESQFGVQIRPWQTAKWDPLVETYEMLDGGKVIGRFYFDSHPRPGKYGHANAVPLRVGLTGRAIPVAALVMNMPAGSHATGLMEHNDVVTFLHEYGHLLHYIFAGNHKWAGQSGISTEWDFVEAPSQMLEEWVYDYDTLKTFAVNAKGETIPKPLVEKMNAARYFGLGMADMRQFGLANVSLRLHQGPAPADIGAATRDANNVFDPLPLPAFTQFQDSFGHLNGYSAIYYTYMWSKVIALDLFTAFQKAGLRDAATAARYRNLVLAPGGTKPAAELVSAFLGRPANTDAYKAEMAKDQ